MIPTQVFGSQRIKVNYNLASGTRSWGRSGLSETLRAKEFECSQYQILDSLVVFGDKTGTCFVIPLDSLVSVERVSE